VAKNMNNTIHILLKYQTIFRSEHADRSLTIKTQVCECCKLDFDNKTHASMVVNAALKVTHVTCSS